MNDLIDCIEVVYVNHIDTPTTYSSDKVEETLDALIELGYFNNVIRVINLKLRINGRNYVVYEGPIILLYLLAFGTTTKHLDLSGAKSPILHALHVLYHMGSETTDDTITTVFEDKVYRRLVDHPLLAVQSEITELEYPIVNILIGSSNKEDSLKHKGVLIP